MKQPDVNIRIVRKEVYVTGEDGLIMTKPPVKLKTETLQYFDPKDGWKDVPVQVEYLSSYDGKTLTYEKF